MTTRVDLGPHGRTLAFLRPAAYSAALRAQVDGLPGVTWQCSLGAYTAPREALPHVLARLKAARVATFRGSVPEVDPPRVAVPSAGLRSYQVDGARRLLEIALTYGGALLGDEQGIGKTAQAVRVCELLAATAGPRPRRHVLVLCPAVVVSHWIDEVKRWSWLSQSTAERWTPASTADFRIMSYDAARRRAKQLAEQQPGVVVFDEAHYLSNAKSLRSKAARTIVGHRPYVLALTGTPIFSEPSDLHNPLDLLTPGRWGTWWQFTHRYCAGRFEEIPGLDRAVWRADGVSNTSELRERLAAVMVRRTKADVAVELPPRVRTVLPVDLPPAAVRSLAKAAACVTMGSDVGNVLANVEEYKLTAAVDLVESLGPQARVLLVTTRRETARKLGAQLGCPHVTGEDDARDRRAMIVGSRLAVATMQSITTGINLTEFDTLVFVGLDWIPSTLMQLEARLHRIGQRSTVSIYYLIGSRTIDEVIQARVIERLDVFADVIGNAPDEAALADHLRGTEDDLIAAILANVQG